MEQLTTIQLIAVWALPVIFGITVHEVAHGWVAKKYGDNTAYQQGRLTLNPLVHIDLVGTIVVPLLLLVTTGFVFGWAKPVPVNQRNLFNPKRDMAIVAAAGPISNFLMAVGWALVTWLGVIVADRGLEAGIALVYMGQAGILINLLLGILNLFPIPPLDGSRIVSSVLPTRAYIAYNRFEPYGFFLLVGLMLAGFLQKVLIPPVMFFFNAFISAISLIS